MKVGVEPLIGEKMIVTPEKMFEINYREAGKNSYYTAKSGREVYTSKSLSYLTSKIRSKGHSFVVVTSKTRSL